MKFKALLALALVMCMALSSVAVAARHSHDDDDHYHPITGFTLVNDTNYNTPILTPAQFIKVKRLMSSLKLGSTRSTGICVAFLPTGAKKFITGSISIRQVSSRFITTAILNLRKDAGESGY